MASGLAQLYGAYASARSAKERKRSWENIQEEIMGMRRAELRHREKVYWPVEETVGPEIARRVSDDPSRYFAVETPFYERAKERMGRAGVAEERQLAQRFAQTGQTARLPQLYKDIARSRRRDITGFTKELAFRKAERIPEEKSRRIREAMSFASAKGPAPSFGGGGYGGGGDGGFDWGEAISGAEDIADFWVKYALRRQEFKGTVSSRFVGLSNRTQRPAIRTSPTTPGAGSSYG